MSEKRRRFSSVSAIIGTAALCVAAARVAGARQEPRHPLALTGVEWMTYGSHEKQAYLSGFLAGAAAEQVSAAATVSGAAAESAAVASGAIAKLRSEKQLHFPYARSVYAAQMDDYYWWTDHRGTPIVDVMISVNRQMLHP